MAGQLWAVDSLGGYMVSLNLSSKLRMALQPSVRFRQFCDAREAFGLGKGDTFNWNVYSDVATAGGSLDETEVMPETNFTIEQNSLTVTEYGNSVPYSGKLDDLSEQPLTEIIHKVLKHDARKALDSAAYAKFDLTPLRVVPTSGNSATAITLTTNGTASTANNLAMNKTHVKLIADQMAERNIPAYDGESYFCIGRPSTFRAFKDELESIHQYTDQGWRIIMNGEKGMYEGIRFIEQTNVASEGWSNAKSDGAFFFGADTVCEAIAIPEEIRGKIPTDFGRDKAIAWYALLGYGLVHDTAAQARIIKWDSTT
jgi:N4-gp56 family major capsid protein